MNLGPPTLRFVDFEKKLENKSLGKVISIFNGFAFKSNDSCESGARWLKIADVGIQQIKHEHKNYLPESFIKNYSKFTLVEGDVVIALTRPVLGKKLKVALVDTLASGALLNQRVGKIITKENQLYVYYLMQTNRVITSIVNNIAGTDPPNLAPSEIKNIPVKVCSKDEQKKIADFLTSVDTKTSQLTEKYRLLKDYKKGVMQQIFSQKIGFKDDDGSAFPEWKKEKIGSYLEPYKELVTADTNIPILTSSRTGLYLQERSVSNEGSYGVVPLGYFTYRHMSDDLIFKFNINTFCERGAVSKEYPVFKTVGMDPYFLQLQLNEGSDFKRFAIQQKLGGTRTRLYFKNLKELQLYLPCLKEQQKIAQFLQSLDKKINAVNEQIEQTKLFKKGLLQQMFV